MQKHDHAIAIDVGGGARMLLPTDLEWHLRYGNADSVRFVAAEVVACYDYLTRDCTAREAMRRLRLLRQVRRAMQAVARVRQAR
jgi:hypothetical protein